MAGQSSDESATSLVTIGGPGALWLAKVIKKAQQSLEVADEHPEGIDGTEEHEAGGQRA